MIKPILFFILIIGIHGQVPSGTIFDYNCPDSGLNSDYCPALLSNATLDNLLNLLQPIRYINNESSMNTSQIIENRGYTFETYEITTADEYNLRLFRMKPKNGIPGPKGPILLQHGLLRNSDCFFEANIGTSIPEALVNAGYDIWFGNNRGTHYSQETQKNFTKSNYWDFCWHEMGIFDDAAMIDFILHKTNYSQMGYIGHSQGTTQILVLLSERKEYNAKLSLVVLLAPVAYVTNMSGVYGNLGTVFGNTNVFANVYLMLGIPKPIQQIVSDIVPKVCQFNMLSQAVCAAVAFQYLGVQPCSASCSTIAFILGHYPDSVPTKSFWHYAQEKKSTNFASYDYRINGVPAQVQQLLSPVPLAQNNTPPRNYTLSNIFTNIVIFHGDLDELATPPDVLRLIGDLGDLVMATYRYANYTHSQFLSALDIKEKINDPLILHFRNYPPVK